jgi:hypothetical protein
MLIGDVCFPADDELRQWRGKGGNLWDDEENYIVFSKLRKHLRAFNYSFHAFSFCCGVIEIGRKDK